MPVTLGLWAAALFSPSLLAAAVAGHPLVGDDAWAIPAYLFLTMSWCLVGAFLATRLPWNTVGWVVLGVGIATGLSLFGQVWASVSTLAGAGDDPMVPVAGILGILFNTAIGLAISMLPLLFPDGTLPSRRWRPVAIAATLGIVIVTLSLAIRPGPIEGVRSVPNPIGIEALGGLSQTVGDIANAMFLLCLPLCVLAPIVRYRRGSAVERQQLKWFGSAVALAAIGIGLASVLPGRLAIAAFMLFTVALGCMPIAIAIAVLRYRLFEIDRIVGRTVAYAIITAILAAAFIATNLGLQALLADVTGSSTLVTAAATLVVAALFQPLRRRVQRVVDARFNRSRIDGERLTDRFAGTVRDQVDLDHLRHAVTAIVDEAVAPAGATVWLRGAR